MASSGVQTSGSARLIDLLSSISTRDNAQDWRVPLDVTDPSNSCVILGLLFQSESIQKR